MSENKSPFLNFSRDTTGVVQFYLCLITVLANATICFLFGVENCPSSKSMSNEMEMNHRHFPVVSPLSAMVSCFSQ